MSRINFLKNMIVILSGLSTWQASAVTVAQNASNIALSSSTVAAEPQLAGTILEDDLIPFSFKGITGTIQQRVVRSSVDNTIDFYWRITNDKTSNGTLTQFHYLEKEVNDYGVTYNIGWRSDGVFGETVPVKVTRFANNALAQGGAQFDFFKSDAEILEGAGIKPGQSTPLFFIDTNKTAYEKTAQSVVSSVSVGSSEVFAAYKVAKEESFNNDSALIPATFENQAIVFQDGKLDIPCVEVYDANGGKVRYQAKLNYIPTTDNELTLELADATFANTKAENCNAFYKDGNLDLPRVEVAVDRGLSIRYQASMSLAPSVGKLRFKLTNARSDLNLDQGYNSEFGVIHRFELTANGKTLEVEDGLFNKGVRVQQYRSYSSNGIVDGHNQEWLVLPGRIVRDRNGTVRHLVRILNYGFMKYLIATDQNKVELSGLQADNSPIGTSVTDENIDPFIGALWEIVPSADGNKIRFRSELNGNFLQAPADNNDGSEMQLGADSHSVVQQFSDIRIAKRFVPSTLRNTAIVMKPTHTTNQKLGFQFYSDCDNAINHQTSQLTAAIALGLNDTTTTSVWEGRRAACLQFTLIEHFLGIYSIRSQALDGYSLQPGWRRSIVIGNASPPENLWIIHDVVREPGKFLIVNGKTGLALIAPLSPGAGALVEQALFLDNDNQKWTMQLPN